MGFSRRLSFAFILLSIASCGIPQSVFANDDVYLCALGETYYSEGQYDKALDEFELALTYNPDNTTAVRYIDKIMELKIREESVRISQNDDPRRNAVMDAEFQRLAQTRLKDARHSNLSRADEADKTASQGDGVQISGEVRMAVGATTDETIWKRANFDLNERNFRILSGNQLNSKENTFDPAVYDHVKLDVDVGEDESKVAFHTNISVDPWSFTGKADKVTVAGAGGDTAEVEILYWSNTGYSVNQTFFTLQNGDAFSLPELKLRNGNIPGTTVTSTFSNTFTIPELNIDRQFQPIREFWFDVKPTDDFKVRVFPMAYEDMALTSDDPLRVSNNHIYWEESPWIVDWRPGNFNSGAGDFSKGEWDDSLAFFTRNSDGIRLTALRGMSLDFAPTDSTSISAVAATPKTLWQDYGEVRALPASMRIKSFLTDQFYVGNTTNLHLGFVDSERDAYNFVSGLDAGVSPFEGLKIEGQVSTSLSEQDLTNETFATKKRGNAYYFGITKTSLTAENVLTTDYYGLQPEEGADYYKHRFFWAQMDEGFESTLSSYRETRDDSYWSRHINFRPPSQSFFSDGQAGLGWNDIQPFAVGNGIDIGRYVFGWRGEVTLWDGDLEGLADIRNVHLVNDKYVETVVRTEVSHKTTSRLTTKLFLLRHDLPDTTGGFDSFIIDPATGDFLTNSAIPDGKDPSLNTASLGMQYEVNHWMTVHGIWEYTNDFTVAADNFPRGILNNFSFTTFTENGQTFRKELPFLFTQGFFDLPPYEYHNIFKTGVSLSPSEKWNVYLDYTRNPFEHAGQIDDNINHVGVEVSYLPTEHLGLRAKYVWSRWNDINRIVNESVVDFQSHHNFFTEVRYNINPEESFRFQYGVGPVTAVSSAAFDPFGGSLITLDTQHIVRAFYQKTF